MRLVRPAAVAAGSILLAAAVTGASAVGSASGRRADPATVPLADVVTIRPDAIHVLDGVLNTPPTTAFCERHYRIACYLPAQIQQAYNLPRLYRQGITGRGQTIIIVDSFGSPTIKNDLGVFDKAFGLPAPPSFRIIQPAGKVPAYDASNTDMVGWAGETTLDVEYAHVIAPDASIVLVETPVSETEGTQGFPQIVAAEKYVLKHHMGDVISQSFSATEETFPSAASLAAAR